jgi:hypothetical protein
MRDATFTESSGNVFADLGLENADELLAQAEKAVEAARLDVGDAVWTCHRTRGVMRPIPPYQASIRMLPGDDDEFYHIEPEPDSPAPFLTCVDRDELHRDRRSAFVAYLAELRNELIRIAESVRLVQDLL